MEGGETVFLFKNDEQEARDSSNGGNERAK